MIRIWAHNTSDNTVCSRSRLARFLADGSACGLQTMAPKQVHESSLREPAKEQLPAHVATVLTVLLMAAALSRLSPGKPSITFHVSYTSMHRASGGTQSWSRSQRG